MNTSRPRALRGQIAAAIAACATTLLASSAGLAAIDGAAAAEVESSTELLDPLGEPVSHRLSRLGLMFDLGTIDGGMLSLVYRPSPWLRVHAGGGTNGAAPGLRGGLSLAPLQQQRGFALSLDAGHFFPGDINGIFSAFAGASYDDSRLLEDFDYDFVNLQAGWEVERSGLMFFVRGGMAFVWAQLPARGLAQLRNLSSLVDPDGSVEAFLPSLRVGLIGFL